jgi:hypothetical protein
MDEAYGQTAEFQTIMEITEGLRGEFGAEIDAHPGSATIEAGQVNRAFRVVTSIILKTIVPRESDLPGLVNWTLRQAAERRLTGAGVSGSMTVTLLDLEPGLGASWHTYLAVAPETVIQDLIDGGGSRGPSE